MKALFWNSEGLRDTAKHFFIQETITEENLDIIAILETGRSNFFIPFLKKLAGGRDFSWSCLPPHGRSGGILVGVHNLTLSVNVGPCLFKMAKIYVFCASSWIE